MKLKALALIPLLLVGILALAHIDKKYSFKPQDPPSLERLEDAITKAQTYYEGLYEGSGNAGAVMAEYYPKINYTVRHATIGGYYYFRTTGNNMKANDLELFIKNNGFDKELDEHSFIWRTKTESKELTGYTAKSYHDCQINLRPFVDLQPYHSKVCKLGKVGVNAYILASRFDTFVPLVQTLQTMSLGNKPDAKVVADFENKYNQLGFGMPMCTPLGCSDVASTIRTATFGEMELRLGNMKYADSVATSLLKSQNTDGAVYISYDKGGNLKVNKPFVYTMLDALLNEKPVSHGFIPTNSETMADVLAFLFHYRCQKYGVACNYQLN